MKVELILPDGLVPEGSVIECRRAKVGEPIVLFHGLTGELKIEPAKVEQQYTQLVVVPPYEFPECIPDGWWIAMDSDGEWYAYDVEPRCGETGFGALNGTCTQELSWLSITLPTVTDWRQSKMQKPVKSC